jgi:hypothetical protein
MDDIKILSLKIILDLADEKKEAIYINAAKIVRDEILKPLEKTKRPE